jgi:hypothetical protein
VVGRAFRFDQQRNDRTELIIFLTPRIMRRDIDAELIKQVEAGRLHFFQDDVEAMHGPIFGVPREQEFVDGMECPPGDFGLPPGPKDFAPYEASSDTLVPGMILSPGTPSSSVMQPDGTFAPGGAWPQGTPLPPGTTYPPGSIYPPGTELPESIPIYDGLVPRRSSSDIVPVCPPPIFDPPTNSHKIQTEYGDWYGRRPIPH